MALSSDLWINPGMKDRHASALKLDEQAARAVSLAEAQLLAAEADRLRGEASPARTPTLPFLRN